MSGHELFIAHLVKVLLLAIVAGLVVRGRHRQCWSFLAYALVVLVCNSLVSFWPEQFLQKWFWILQQGSYDIAKLAIALELAWRVSQRFPGAAARGRLLLLAIVVLTILSILRLPLQAPFRALLTDWHPRVLAGTIWLFTGTALLMVWYRLPLPRFPRMLLLGFSAYLLVFSTLLSILGRVGPSLRTQISAFDGWAYTVLVAWWAYEAWRPVEQPVADPAVLRALAIEEA